MSFATSYKPKLHTAATPGQIARAKARPRDPYREEYERRGYMVFDDVADLRTPEQKERDARIQQEIADEMEIENEAIQRANEQGEKMMSFLSENPDFYSTKYRNTGAVQRAAARDEIWIERKAEKERRQEEQMKALIKHRSVVKQMNLQNVAGTPTQVEETKRRTAAKIAEEKERVRLLKEAEELRKAELEADWQRRFHTPKPYVSKKKQPSYQTVVFNAPRKKGPFEFEDPEDQEMFDILNELQTS